MFDKIILIENGQEVQCSNLENVVKILIDENFYNLSNIEKIKKMRMMALANCLNFKREIVDDVNNDDIDGKFIVKDEITYVLSLLTLNNVIMLERKDANLFTKSLPKDNLKGNYIVVNKFARDLLKEYIKKNL